MYNEDGTVTLWHGSPLENLESILKHGIIPNPLIDEAIVRVENMMKEIEKKLGVKLSLRKKAVRYVKQMAINRILEAKEHGNVVYVSGHKEYAISNSLASKEWIGMILDLALSYKYADYYEKLRQIYRRKFRIEQRLSKILTKSLEALNKGDDKKYFKLSLEEKKLEVERLMLENLKEKDSELKRISKEIERIKLEFRGRKAVIFEIRLPKEVFFSTLADDYSRRMVALYEGIVKEETEYLKAFKGEAIQELHLKEVRPEYIVSYEIIEKRKDFPCIEHKVIEKKVLKS